MQGRQDEKDGQAELRQSQKKQVSNVVIPMDRAVLDAQSANRRVIHR